MSSSTRYISQLLRKGERIGNKNEEVNRIKMLLREMEMDTQAWPRWKQRIQVWSLNFSILVSDEKMRLQRMVKENGRKKKDEKGLGCL